MARPAANYPTGILQRINAAQQFTGAAHPGAQTTTRNGSMYEYAAADAGGLFYWDNQEPMVIDQILVDLGATGTCDIYLVNLDANNAVIAGERWRIHTSPSGQYIALNHATLELVVGPKQAIQIISGTSAAAKTALVTGSIERAYMR